jgi:outer membrane protein TolC
MTRVARLSFLTLVLLQIIPIQVWGQPAVSSSTSSAGNDLPSTIVNTATITDEPTPPPPSSQPTLKASISLSQVLADTLSHAYELKLASLDIAIAQTQIREAQAEYWPQLQGRLNTEYLRDLSPERQPGFNVVGNQIIVNNTTFQNSAGLSANYTLFDFGARKRKVLIARIDTNQKREQLLQRTRELLLQVVDAYGDAWLLDQERVRREAMLLLARQRFLVKQHLYEAGAISKLDVADSALLAAEQLETLDQVRERLSQALKALSALTRVDYASNSTLEAIAAPDEGALSETLSGENALPEVRVYDLEIEKKQHALEVLRRERFAPQLGLYSNYYLYGADRNNAWQSMANLRNRTASIGLSVGLPIFDGFKNAAQRERTRLEIERLRVQRADALDKFKRAFDQNQTLIHSLEVVQVSAQKTVEHETLKKELIERLSAQQLIERSEKLKAEYDVLSQKLVADRTQARQRVAQAKARLYLGEMQ